MQRLLSTMSFHIFIYHAHLLVDHLLFIINRFSEKDKAIDYFGEQLLAAGYNYYGNEPMYSGITGQEFAADIYIGVVYYQRLRHMVLDKFQVRTTGPVDPITRQPVKVRKRCIL
jgi:DNA-directed RNA polymerase I subunit RPA2